jgi:branched-chain amino acid transport system substrate-binding protein
MTRYFHGRGAATLFLAAAALLPLAACVGKRTPAEQREARASSKEGDIVLAAVWPWATRKEIRFGEGVDLAVEEINAAGGIGGRKLKVLREDDHESVNDGLMVAQKVSQDANVVAVIGHLQSFVTVPAAATYEAAGVVLVSPVSTDPDLTAKGYRHVFRVVNTNAQTGAQMADFAAGRGYRHVAIYYVDNSYGHTLAQAFEEEGAQRGVQVAARAAYDPDQDMNGRGFQPTLQQWKQLQPDAIFVAGEVPLAGRLIAEIREAGITAPVLGTDAMASPSLISVGGKAVEGTVVPTFFDPAEESPVSRRFVQAFQKRYGVLPDAGSALGYDAVNVIARGLRQAGSTSPAALADAIRRIQGMEGTTGTFSYRDNGDLSGRQMVLTVVRNGRFEYLPAGAPAQTADATPAH